MALGIDLCLLNGIFYSTSAPVGIDFCPNRDTSILIANKRKRKFLATILEKNEISYVFAGFNNALTTIGKYLIEENI